MDGQFHVLTMIGVKVGFGRGDEAFIDKKGRKKERKKDKTRAG